jgi:hypothetical protein
MLQAIQSRPAVIRSPNDIIFEIKNLYMASHYHDCIGIARREISYTNETVRTTGVLKIKNLTGQTHPLHRAALYFYAGLASDTWARNMPTKSKPLLPLLDQAESMYTIAMTVLEESTFTSHPLPETHPQSHKTGLFFAQAPPAPAFLPPSVSTPSRPEQTKSSDFRVPPTDIRTPTSPTKKSNRSHLPLFSPSPRRILPTSPALVLQTVLEDGSPIDTFEASPSKHSPKRGGDRSASEMSQTQFLGSDPFLPSSNSQASLSHIPSPVASPASSITPRPSTVFSRGLIGSSRNSIQSPTRGLSALEEGSKAVNSPMTERMDRKLDIVQQDMPWSTSSQNTAESRWRSARLAYEARNWRNMVGSQVRSVGRFREKVCGKARDGERGRSLWRRGEEGEGFGGYEENQWF